MIPYTEEEWCLVEGEIRHYAPSIHQGLQELEWLGAKQTRRIQLSQLRTKSVVVHHNGRFCVILFHGMKCGTEQVDNEVLTFTDKAVPHRAGYDDDDYGTRGYSRNVSGKSTT